MAKYIVNKEDMVVEIYFETCCPEEIREVIKKNGYKWNKVKNCWYADNNKEMVAVASQVAEEFHSDTKSKCLLCGKKIDIKECICNNCKPNVSEELCVEVADFNINKSENELWIEIASSLLRSYDFRYFSLQLADYIEPERQEYVKMLCMNMFNRKYPGVPTNYSDYVIENADKVIDSVKVNGAEKNLIRALLLNVMVKKGRWFDAEKMIDEVTIDELFFEPYYVLSDYYNKIRNYEEALEIMRKAKKIFVCYQTIIEEQLDAIKKRMSGEMNAWKPKGEEERILYYDYLKSRGIVHEKKKVKESDFKEFHRYDNDNRLPNNYVAFWIAAESHHIIDVPVEMFAIKVQNAEIVDCFQSFIKPRDKMKSYKYVSEDDLKEAKPMGVVYDNFIKFAGDSVLASLGFEEQKGSLSRLARYAGEEEIPNLILDVIEYEEDNTEGFIFYNRETLLKKYNIKDKPGCDDKAKVTYKLIEKMRKQWN